MKIRCFALLLNKILITQRLEEHDEFGFDVAELADIVIFCVLRSEHDILFGAWPQILSDFVISEDFEVLLLDELVHAVAESGTDFV